jgi:hypothetical protein
MKHKSGYSMDVGLEKVVVAFLSGFTPQSINAGSRAILHNREIGPLYPVYVGTYHVISAEIELDSDIKSAVALQGVKAQDILNALLVMRHIDTDVPVVVVDKHKGTTSPAVCALEAVYEACRYVLLEKILRNAIANQKSVTQNKPTKIKSKV